MTLERLKSLHARLFAIVLLAMLPVLFMALFMARDRYQEAKASSVAASQQLARFYSSEGKALFERARVLLTEAAALDALHSLDSAACAEILASLGREHPEYGTITLSRPDGRPIASSMPRAPQSNPAGTAWFKDALRTKAFAVGSYQAGVRGDRARLPLALPVLAQDHSVLAVLSLSLDLEVLAGLLGEMPLPEGAAVTILDHSGTILARFPAEPLAIGRPVPEAESFLPRLKSGANDTWQSVGVDGVERIYFLSPLLNQKGRDIVLRIGMPAEVAFAAASQGAIRSVSLITAMTFIALFTTWLFSNTFVLRQIKTLWLATAKLSAGDYSHRIGESGSGELSDLATAFDSMAGELESRAFRLASAEQKYRKIFEDSVSGIFQTTPGGQIRSANPALARIFGFSSPQELISSVSDIGSQLYEEPEVRKEIQKLLKRDGLVKGFEFRARRADGERVWLSVDVKAIKALDGTIAFYEGIMSDITDRKRVEEALRNKQEKLQALLDHSPALIAIKDAEGRYLLVNRRHQELHGNGRSVIGQSADDLFEPDEARLIREEDRHVLAEGTPLTFQRSLSVKGVRHHFLSVKFPLFDEAGKPDRVCIMSYDITEYEQVREALRLSEEKYRTMIQTSPELIWVIDPRGFILEANNASHELLGYDPEELGGLHVDQLVHPDDLQVPERTLPAGQGGTDAPDPGSPRGQLPRSTKNLSVRLIPKARGNRKPIPRHFELSSSWLWRGREFLGTMVVARDVTERKRAEEALRASQAFTQAVIDASPDCIKVLDAEGRLRFMSQGGQRLLGITDLEPFLGRHYLDFWAQADALGVSRAMDTAQQTGQGRFEGFCPTVAGEPKWWDVLMTPLTDRDESRRLLVVSRDVTNIKQAEAELRESRGLLAATQAIGRIGGWSINLDTRERKGTEELFRLIGLKSDELPDLDEAVALVAPEDRALYTEVVRRAEELGEGFDVELRLALQEPGARWVRFMGNRTDSRGERMLSGSVQDITDTKSLEMLRDDIDTIIRHDLKNPLNSIINLPQLILSGGDLSVEQVEYLNFIEASGRNLLRQVEMSLDMMQIERGRYQFQPNVFDFIRVIRDIVSGMQEASRNKQCSLELLVEGESASEDSTFWVRSEERLCYPMLTNLLQNALEASPPGERITVSLTGGAEQRISIRNLGAVPQEIRARFFEKYVTSGKFKGTGLGTYSANLFARAQGGSLELDASEQGATTVVVHLPRINGPLS